MSAGTASAQTQAYLRAIYMIDAADPLTLRVGCRCMGLERLAASQQSGPGGAFLTACNPRSRRLRPAANARRMRALERTLARDGYTWLPGRGLDPDDLWPEEPSLWVPGLPIRLGQALARRFGQNAFLWCDGQSQVHLIWTPHSGQTSTLLP